MGDGSQQPPPQGVSSWPAPPMQYIKNYTDDSVSRGKAPAPPPTLQERYHVFGAPFEMDEKIIRSLDDQSVSRLYPLGDDPKRQLKKLNMSLQMNFLDLLAIMAKSPESAERQEKVDDIRLIFINMYHLVNEFRPHQARETLRLTIDAQKRQRADITKRFTAQLERVHESIQTCVAQLTSGQDVHSDAAALSAAKSIANSIQEEFAGTAGSGRERWASPGEGSGRGDGGVMEWGDGASEGEAWESESVDQGSVDEMLCGLVDKEVMQMRRQNNDLQ